MEYNNEIPIKQSMFLCKKITISNYFLLNSISALLFLSCETHKVSLSNNVIRKIKTMMLVRGNLKAFSLFRMMIRMFDIKGHDLM